MKRLKRVTGEGKDNPLDLIFEPMLLASKGQRSAFDLLLRRDYSAALEGKPDAVRIMLRIMRAHAKALNADEGQRPPLLVREGPQAIVPAFPAMRLLGITRLNGRTGRLGLSGWMVDCLRQRGVSTAALAGIEHVAGPEAEQAADDYDLHRDPDYVPPSAPRLPEATWFPKGRSGNPAGRPPKQSKSLPFSEFLHERMVVRINGDARPLTRLEALLYQLQLKALKGDEKIARLLMAYGLDQQVKRLKSAQRKVVQLAYECAHQFGDDPLIGCLLAAGAINRRTRKHVLLEPWVVAAAVQRLAPRSLDEEEQAVVVRSTSTPHKVSWPDWWAPQLRVRQRMARHQGKVRTQWFGGGGW